ncbi:YveK family protein [Oceanirhabdus sp. W0125-5]|uniref:YveK family protein n=1 Tax=Oceanirhabdus sp. W0125-5 TaxID=2999116 RepID=UPI0022F2AAB1|nr:hypothetical protein [Oceanirhabdus sp. W0125-5]WBW98971.1 hypothetical protein OW730_09555 [Oceanirhabdus sp. W0125-5]
MNEEMGLNLKEFLQIIYRRKILVILITIFCVTLGGTLTLVSRKYNKMPVTYQAFVYVIMGNTKEMNGDFELFQRRASTYEMIANSSKVIEKVNQEFKDYSYWGLKGKAEKGTQRFIISVQALSHADALKIAERYTEIFIEECMNMLPISELNIFDQEQKAHYPFVPSLKKNLVIAFLVGIVLAIGLCLLIEILDTKLKDEEDLKELIDIPVLASIPYDKRLVVK